MNIPEMKRLEGYNFLKYCITKLNCQDRAIHNILIYFLAESSSSKELNLFLNEIQKNRKNSQI
jgi:hypothetical protein